MLWGDTYGNRNAPGRERQYTTHIVRSECSLLQEVKNLKNVFPTSRIGIVHFGSPIHPGGSVIQGGDGLEEFLCRCTTLYPCLATTFLRQQYYEKNRLCEEDQYRNVGIYIPDVVCFREDSEESRIMKQSDWFLVDVISCVPSQRELLGDKVPFVLCLNKI